jgi:hypothetical protein
VRHILDKRISVVVVLGWYFFSNVNKGKWFHIANHLAFASGVSIIKPLPFFVIQLQYIRARRFSWSKSRFKTCSYATIYSVTACLLHIECYIMHACVIQ